MPHAYTEDQLVEQPAIGLFAELGWQTVSALEETFGAPSPGLAATLSRPTGEGQVGEGASLGRETKGEVVLVSRLRAALERLNAGRMGHHALPPEAITAAAPGILFEGLAGDRCNSRISSRFLFE
jgi:type I restriction enzyme R subunit